MIPHFCETVNYTSTCMNTKQRNYAYDLNYVLDIMMYISMEGKQ